MKHLLDVNALVALGFFQHEFHERVAHWVRFLAAEETPELATCSITELGFIRVMAQAPQYGFDISKARALLLRLKTARTAKFTFLSDDQDVSHLPAWVKAAKRTTDAHLLQLARSKGCIFATLDRRIPGEFLIPANS